MKRIVMLVLTMLIGGYGAARAQTPAETEKATKAEADAQEFLGMKWGAGVGVMGGFGGAKAVKSASIVTVDKNTQIVQVEEEGELRPQLFLEMHAFLWGDQVKRWREYQRKKGAYETAMAQLKARESQAAAAKEETAESKAAIKESVKKAMEALVWPSMPTELPDVGYGPFVALQSSDEKAINALTVGIMGGARKVHSKSLSVNIGIGVSFDPSVQVLAKGFNDGVAPPNGETAVRFKKEGRFGWVLMTSFTF